jgi:hypothetical protein
MNVPFEQAPEQSADRRVRTEDSTVPAKDLYREVVSLLGLGVISSVLMFAGWL